MSHRGIVVVSGASRGVGRAAAEMLADSGYLVFAGVLNQGEAAAWHDARVSERRLVSDSARYHTPGAYRSVADGRSMWMGGGLRICALVSVAGLAQFDAIEHVDHEVMRRIFDVNVFGALALTQALLPRIKQDHARLVFVTSMAAKASAPLLGVYSATKSAMEISDRRFEGGASTLGCERCDRGAGRYSHPHDGRSLGPLTPGEFAQRRGGLA